MRSKRILSRLIQVGPLAALSVALLVGVSFGAPAQAQEGATFGFSPAIYVASRGEVFTLDLQIEDAEDLAGVEFDMFFDPDVVQIGEVTIGPFLGSTGRDVTHTAVVDNDAGMLEFVAFSVGDEDGADGAGVLLTLELEAAERGATLLDLENVTVCDTAGECVAPVVVDGLVLSVLTMEVSPAFPEEWVNPGEFTETVWIYGARDLGGYGFSMAFDPDIVQVTDVADASFLGSTGREVLPFDADIDNEAGVLSFGAVSAGEQPGATGDGALATITFEAIAEGDTALDLFGQQVFDTGGMEEVPDTLNGLVHVVGPGVSIAAPPSVYEGYSVTIQVMVGDAEDLAGYEFSMDFDPDLFQVESVVDGGFLNEEVIPTGPDIDNENGTVTFGAVSTGGGVDGMGALAEITLMAQEVDADQMAVLDLHDVTLFDSEANPTIPVITDGEILVKNCIPVQITSLTSDSPVTLGETMHFTATTTGSEPVTYEWDFDSDGVPEQSGEGLASTTYTFDTPGSHTVTLSVENPCGTDEETLVVEVCEPVSIDDFVSNSPVTLGETMYFTATMSGSEPITYDWDFGGAGTLVGGGEETGEFVYDAAGTYTVTLSVENDCGTDEATLVVEVCEPVSIDDFVSNSPVGIGDTMYFTATVSGSEPITYDWDFGGAGTLVGGGEETGAFVYDEPGTYTVVLSVENDCGEDEATLDVTVEGYMLFLPVVAKNYTP
ncbi:MAG: cohesin domain-containing protein [Anaerolineae bacterium]